MKLEKKDIRKIIIALVPVTAILFSYQNCSPGYEMSQGPKFDSEGNLTPPKKFQPVTEPVTGSDDSEIQSSTEPGTDTETGSDNGNSLTENGHSGNSQSDNGSPLAPKCINKKLSAKQRALKTANAYELAKKFLQSRRCNSFLSGPKGQAKNFIHEAHLDNFCLSDARNTLEILRQVGLLAGMQDLDQYNAVEKWIDCFCNVTGKSICPELQAKKAKDIYDIQEHFIDPKKRKPAVKLEDIPLNEDDVSGVDEVLND